MGQLAHRLDGAWNRRQRGGGGRRRPLLRFRIMVVVRQMERLGFLEWKEWKAWEGRGTRLSFTAPRAHVSCRASRHRPGKRGGG